jgi:hypothetical protein
MRWEDISKRLSGRSAVNCRLHYQNYLERRNVETSRKRVASSPPPEVQRTVSSPSYFDSQIGQSPRLHRTSSDASLANSVHSDVTEYDSSGRMTKRTVTTTNTYASNSDIRGLSSAQRSRVPPRAPDGGYICDYEGCELKPIFKRLMEWNKHMDRHEKPYRCLEPGCGSDVAFTYSGGLLRHQREVHNMHLPKKQSIYCPFPDCKRATGSGFTRRENLAEHIRRVHSQHRDNSTALASPGTSIRSAGQTDPQDMILRSSGDILESDRDAQSALRTTQSQLHAFILRAQRTHGAAIFYRSQRNYLRRLLDRAGIEIPWRPPSPGIADPIEQSTATRESSILQAPPELLEADRLRTPGSGFAASCDGGALVGSLIKLTTPVSPLSSLASVSVKPNGIWPSMLTHTPSSQILESMIPVERLPPTYQDEAEHLRMTESMM